MAYFGKFELILQDSAGNVQASTAVEVRKRGATCNGAQSSVTTVTVYNPGAIVAGDTVELNTTGTFFVVSSVTATTVVLASSITVADGDRLIPSTNRPTLYVDSSATTTKANPLTTDASGVAFAYVRGGSYDAISGTSTKTLFKDVPVVAESLLSPEYTSPLYLIDTLRTAAASDKILSVKMAGSEKFYVKGDGTLKGAHFDAAVTIDSGGLTVTSGGLGVVSGGISVTSGTSIFGGIVTFNDALDIGPAGFVDCNLYRDTANHLKTDDSLEVLGTLYASGYTRVLSPPEVTVSSATITVPAAGTVIMLTASSPQTVTAISGAVAGQILVFVGKTGTSAITFSGANFVFNGATAVLDDSSTGSVPAMMFVYDGTVFRILASPRN